MSEIVRWGDQQQYISAPIKREGGLVKPQVHLLWATPDPLGAIAAACRMYKGIPTYDLAEITDEERQLYFEESFKSHLRAPHEFVVFHFFIEAVSRSFTHQMVRQRTAVFAQESLRFAVKEGLASETPYPPSVVGDEQAEDIWHETVCRIEKAYEALVNSGVPAEDARGLLPHATVTRLNYCTNLRALLEHAGNRLCTQAQFEWRQVFWSLMGSIRRHASTYWHPHESLGIHPCDGSWQWELLGKPSPETFSPICYKTGKCEFEAIFDRDCSIRGRVKALGAAGVPSTEWDTQHGDIPGINPAEWMANPAAARRT